MKIQDPPPGLINGSAYGFKSATNANEKSTRVGDLTTH